jgi:hypothetical protein
MLNKDQILGLLRVFSSVFLGIVLLLSLIAVVNYNQEVKEALDMEKPIRLISLYEEKTGESCYCSINHYSNVRLNNQGIMNNSK